MPATRASRRPPPDHVALLQRQPLFGELERAQLTHLVSYAKSNDVAAGTTLFRKGDPGTALFAIRSGTVKITVPAADGREAVFNLLQDGDIFGEIALLDGHPRTADAVTTTSTCDLLVIERRDFSEIRRRQSEGRAQDHRTTLRAAALDQRTFRRGGAREFAGAPGANAAASDQERRKTVDQNSIKITQQELSQVLGATRESVNRQLRGWETQKLITLDRGGIVIHSLDQLAAIAKQPSSVPLSDQKPKGRGAAS